jgi:hypothetical protein
LPEGGDGLHHGLLEVRAGRHQDTFILRALPHINVEEAEGRLDLQRGESEQIVGRPQRNDIDGGCAAAKRPYQ